ncbi:MAG: hypothetical protein ABSA97_09625 [Verrucomicrobiia bacterium]|jgi:hypothetical protein
MNLMQKPSPTSVVWIRTGLVAGLSGCLIYPSIIFLRLPKAALVVLAAAIGPLLAVTSLGLGKLLQLPRPSVSAQLAMMFNFAAGVLVSAMLLVQLAIKARLQGAKASPEIVGIWLGLDVAFDVYVGLGTGLFALSMLRHPRFGRVFGGIGLIIAALLLGLNLFTFPTPPADAGLFDLGPIVGLWYLVVLLQAWRSMRWAHSIASARAEEIHP